VKMRKINKRGQGLPSSTRIMLLVSARDNATIVKAFEFKTEVLYYSVLSVISRRFDLFVVQFFLERDMVVTFCKPTQTPHLNRSLSPFHQRNIHRHSRHRTSLGRDFIYRLSAF
jgi:hypothetical protein